jgi:hypothetical protein
MRDPTSLQDRLIMSYNPLKYKINPTFLKNGIPVVQKGGNTFPSLLIFWFIRLLSSFWISSSLLLFFWSPTEVNYLMIFQEMIDVSFDNYTKPINTLCRETVQYLNDQAGGGPTLTTLLQGIVTASFE